MDRYSKTFAALQSQSHSVRLLNYIRPNILATPFYKLMLPSQRRGIVAVDGIRLYLDPASHLGHTVLTAGYYEPDTVAVLRQHIKPGNVVLDIGANEGVMSATPPLLWVGLAASSLWNHKAGCSTCLRSTWR